MWVTGYLEVVDFEAGDTVDEGKIDPRPYQAELDRADAERAATTAIQRGPIS